MSESKKWTTTAGPIQTKRVNEALSAIQCEGRTTSEKSGVIGVSEHEWSSMAIFGPLRQDAVDALAAIGEQFAFTVTRENYQQIIESAGKHLELLKAVRPVKDERRTPEQEAARQAEWQEAEQKRQAEANEKSAGATIAGIEHGGPEDDAQAWCSLKLTVPAAPALTATPAVSASGATVSYNAEHNGVEIRFPSKPSAEVLSSLKGSGFRWALRNKCWYHKYCEANWTRAHQILGLTPASAPTAAPSAPDRFDMQVEDQMQAACGL